MTEARKEALAAHGLATPEAMALLKSHIHPWHYEDVVLWQNHRKRPLGIILWFLNIKDLVKVAKLAGLDTSILEGRASRPTTPSTMREEFFALHGHHLIKAVQTGLRKEAP